MIKYDQETHRYIFPIKEEIHTRLNKFLEVQKLSDGGYAEVSNEEFSELSELINDIIHLKYEMDCDGDIPIEFALTDRNKYERSRFFPMPYTHNATTLKELIDALSCAEYNLATAQTQIKNIVNSIRWLIQDGKV